MNPSDFRVLNSHIDRLPEFLRDRYEHHLDLLKDDLSLPFGDKFGTRFDLLSQFQTGIILDFFEQHRHGATLQLMNYIDSGNAFILRRFIMHRNSKKLPYPGGFLLMYASFLGRIEIIQLLLEFGWDVNTSDNFTDGVSMSALCFAVMNNQLHAMKLLISVGADVNHKCRNGVTPLLLACNCGHVMAIFELISHSDVDITYTNDSGSGVLCEVLEGLNRHFGDVRPMLLLLLYGAPLNQRLNNSGLTPLQIACFRYHLDPCVLLVSFGADTDMVAYNGSNITDLLMNRNNKNDHSACRILTALLDIKPDLDISSLSSRGKTPLILAVDMLVAGAGDETFDLLCEHVTDPSIGDRDTGRTVLHELAQVGEYKRIEKVLRLLWKLGVYPDNKDVFGKTPESIARDEAEKARRPGDIYVERMSRYLEIAELIHSFSWEFAIGKWGKRTKHGLQADYGYNTNTSRKRRY
jgi:ankyrin repeat protein